MKVNVNVDLDIELNDSQKDEITVESLKDAYRINCEPDKYDCSDETIPPDEEFLNALDLVISYFTNSDQYQEWLKVKETFRSL